MESALDSYGRHVTQEEEKQYTAMQSELAEYWRILDPVFRWNAAERTVPAAAPEPSARLSSR